MTPARITLPAVVRWVWRALPGGVQWRILAAREPRFMVAVSGVVRAPDGRILLLDHQLWPAGATWGVPTGYINRGETLDAALARELREEVGYAGPLGPVRVADVNAGFRLRVEITVACDAPSAFPVTPDGTEVRAARWVRPDDLPAEVAPAHRARIAAAAR